MLVTYSDTKPNITCKVIEYSMTRSFIPRHSEYSQSENQKSILHILRYETGRVSRKNPGDACGLHIFPENRADIQIARAKAFNSNQCLRSKVANNTNIQIQPGLTEKLSSLYLIIYSHKKRLMLNNEGNENGKTNTQTRKKTIRLVSNNKKNNNFARTAHFFFTFLCRCLARLSEVRGYCLSLKIKCS